MEPARSAPPAQDQGGQCERLARVPGRAANQYDFFVQLDIDHRPDRTYLDRVLGYFDDPGIAWVQAPSVCGNLGTWTARGLAEQELVFQGPLQMGFYGAPERHSSSDRTRPTGPRPFSRSEGFSRPVPRTTWIPWCWQRTAIAASSSRHDRHRRRPRGLQDLPAAAVRVGPLDDHGSLLVDAAAAAPLHACTGIPVPLQPDVVPAVVGLDAHALGSAAGRSREWSTDRRHIPWRVPSLLHPACARGLADLVLLHDRGSAPAGCGSPGAERC